MAHLQYRLRDFGKKYGFIPKTKEDIRDDFAYVDHVIKDLAYQAKTEIDDYYAKKEGVIPFHWNKISIRLGNMPCSLEYAVDWGKKVLKNIKGYFGIYANGSKDIYINKHLLELNDNQELLKTTIKHEAFHSLQDELDILRTKPRWQYEAEASMFAVDDFENTDFSNTGKHVGYRNWTMNYIWRYGKRLMTSFKDRFMKINDHFTDEELQET